jgi:glutamate-1-semialdehyde aminotransferase
MIMEPMMMNAGIIPPEPGYLEGVRELTRQHGALLAFDEVKTGMVVHWGGVTRLFGVTPDLVCLAKALGGGIPCGAIGGTEEGFIEPLFQIVDSGRTRAEDILERYHGAWNRDVSRLFTEHAY